jgi:hypothetical protein
MAVRLFMALLGCLYWHGKQREWVRERRYTAHVSVAGDETHFIRWVGQYEAKRQAKHEFVRTDFAVFQNGGHHHEVSVEIIFLSGATYVIMFSGQ